MLCGICLVGSPEHKANRDQVEDKMKGQFNIKNYTTEIPADRSILEIEKLLTLFGAGAIIKEYTDGKVFSLSFKLQDEAFRLPSNVKGVKEILFKGVRDQKDSDKRREDKAYRVSWRILKDWTHAQLSLIASGQAQALEIFLPYMFDGKTTLYQKFMEGKLLTAKKEK